MSPRDRNAKIASRTVPDDYEEDETLPVESTEQDADDAVDHPTEAPRAHSRRTGTEETIELDEDEDDGLSDTEREEVRQEALRAKKTTGRGGAAAITKKGTASTSKVPGLKRARAMLEDEIETRSGPEPVPKRRALTGAPAKGKGPAAEDEVEEDLEQDVDDNLLAIEENRMVCFFSQTMNANTQWVCATTNPWVPFPVAKFNTSRVVIKDTCHDRRQTAIKWVFNTQRPVTTIPVPIEGESSPLLRIPFVARIARVLSDILSTPWEGDWKVAPAAVKEEQSLAMLENFKTIKSRFLTPYVRPGEKDTSGRVLKETERLTHSLGPEVGENKSYVHFQCVTTYEHGTYGYIHLDKEAVMAAFRDRYFELYGKSSTTIAEIDHYFIRTENALRSTQRDEESYIGNTNEGKHRYKKEQERRLETQNTNAAKRNSRQGAPGQHNQYQYANWGDQQQHHQPQQGYGAPPAPYYPPAPAPYQFAPYGGYMPAPAPYSNGAPAVYQQGKAGRPSGQQNQQQAARPDTSSDFENDGYDPYN